MNAGRRLARGIWPLGRVTAVECCALLLLLFMVALTSVQYYAIHTASWQVPETHTGSR